ncbi:MAG: aminopeptidase, partial [Polaromonas sp.]
PGDTVFNESFATAVERLGVQRWLDARASQSSDEARQVYATFDARRQQFRALTLETRRELAVIYDGKEAVAQYPRSQEAIKNIAMQRFRDNYAQLKASWGGYSGYDPWVARANNASLSAQAAYDELVPGFEALFEREGRDWQRFYDAVNQLARLPRHERHAILNTNKLPPARELAVMLLEVH